MRDIGYFEIMKGIVLIFCVVSGKGNMSVPEGTFNCDLALRLPFPFTVAHGDPSRVFCLSLYLPGGAWLPSVGKAPSLMSISFIACQSSNSNT